MARFIGTQEEFIKFIGGYTRNKVQYMSQKYRKGIAKCEHCNTKKDLQSAHVKGRERVNIIGEILSGYINDDIIDIDLQEFEDRYISEHQPVEKTFKILCRRCHTEYDNSDVYNFDNQEPLLKETEEIKKVTTQNLNDKSHRIEKWNNSRNQLSHKAIAYYLKLLKDNGSVTRDQFTGVLDESGYTNARGTVASLMTNAGNSYGRIFCEENGQLIIIPELRKAILDKEWSI